MKMNPKEYKYTKEHEWIKVEGDIGTIGITNFAQEHLGDIVSVEFPNIGKEFSAGESLALVDSMKTTSEVYAPVSGEVMDVNSELESQPELMNEDPFGKGWILKLKIKNPDELEKLMNVEDYEAYMEKEGENP
jgi:glycine cleavage system H protein